MTYCMAVFKSRYQAIECKGALLKAGIEAELVSTPAALRIGCGLSVKFPAGAHARVRAMIARAGYTAFYGYMNI